MQNGSGISGYASYVLPGQADAQPFQARKFPVWKFCPQKQFIIAVHQSTKCLQVEGPHRLSRGAHPAAADSKVQQRNCTKRYGYNQYRHW